MLKGAAALGAFALSGCGSRSIYPDWLDEAPLVPQFPLGVASGDVTDTSAVLWTRYAGSAPLALTVALDDGVRERALREPVIVRPVEAEDGGFVHAQVDGLAPGARYAFAFEEAGGDGAVASGAFRAAPAPGALEPLVFSASSCSRNGRSFGALLQGAAREADVHLLLGDTSYNDGARALAEYREKWAQNLGTGAYRTMRARRSVLATWDDHEIANDWCGADLDAELLQNGTAAFFEHTPVRRDPSAPNRLWRSVRWGDTAEFFLMDGRSERRPDTRGTDEAEYISAAQMDWLLGALASSTARFKVLVNSVPITDFPGLLAGWSRDRWTAYAAQRDALLWFLEREPIKGAFFVSGDFHMACMGRVARAGEGSSLTEVLAGPIAASGNPAWAQCVAPQFQFSTDTENTTFFDLDPQSGEVRVRWIAADGRTLADRSFHP